MNRITAGMRYPGLRQTIFEIIAVGYELLDGRTLDTNSKWLAERITELGGMVRRMTTIGDDLNDISSAIREAVRRKPDWIITSGGLGPTYDDMTLQGVAKALGRRLVLNRKALRMIEERYRALAEQGVIESSELSPHRIKMAMLPRGAKPLRNEVGTAPGALMRYKRTMIACLPGVPRELYSIYENELEPIIIKRMRKVYRLEKWFTVIKVPESTLAPKIDLIRKAIPGVYLKSHPKSAEGISKIEIQIIAAANRRDVAERRLEKAKEMIEEAVRSLEGIISERVGDEVE